MIQSMPNSLNSKGELGRCEIQRLVIEDDSYKLKIKEFEEKKKEELDVQKWKDLVERAKKGNAGEKRKTPSYMENQVEPPTKKEKNSKFNQQSIRQPCSTTRARQNRNTSKAAFSTHR